MSRPFRALRRLASRAPKREEGWHREAVGGMWDEVGALQLRFLKDHGLQTHHYLLDVGCGSLRGCVHFVDYLDSGRYYGVDLSAELMEAARRHELEPRGLDAKHPRLEQMDDFGFGRLGSRFDFAIAVSVFTHLSLNSILRCLVGIEEVLVDGGRFFATFFENERGWRHLDPVPRDVPAGETYMDRNPYHYDPQIFEALVSRSRLTAEYIGEWGHPRGQRMIAFTKRTTAMS